MSNDPLAIAQLGVEIEQFKSSDIGKYLLARAKDDIITASEQLISVEPNDVFKITSLQNKANVANSFIVWLEEGIEAGNFAMQNIQEQ